MTRRNDLDWDLIETDYRVAQLSIRQIAEKHGTEASTITRRAKKNGWTRDLTEAVRAATKAKVRNAVAHVAQQDAERCTRLITSEVDLAANVNATIILRQQGRAGVMADMFEVLALENNVVNENPEILDEIAKAIKENDPKGAESLKRLKSLTTRINNLKALADINAKLNEAEDFAFSLKEHGKGDGSYEKLLAEVLAEDCTK